MVTRMKPRSANGFTLLKQVLRDLFFYFRRYHMFSILATVVTVGLWAMAGTGMIVSFYND